VGELQSSYAGPRPLAVQAAWHGLVIQDVLGKTIAWSTGSFTTRVDDPADKASAVPVTS
jgi:hypothetical protein